MLWAISSNNTRILPQKNLVGYCPLCKEQLIPKCGLVNRWHWSHKSLKNCDDWYESESDWHINWKNEFYEEQQEVIIENHIADIKNHNGLVIELQNSPISADDIMKRELHYNNMIWLINGDKLAKGLEVRFRPKIITFRWYHPSKSWWVADKPIYVDIGDDLIFLIKKIYHNVPCGGWGKILTKKEFLEIFSNKLKKENDDRK